MSVYVTMCRQNPQVEHRISLSDERLPFFSAAGHTEIRGCYPLDTLVGYTIV